MATQWKRPVVISRKTAFPFPAWPTLITKSTIGTEWRPRCSRLGNALACSSWIGMESCGTLMSAPSSGRFLAMPKCLRYVGACLAPRQRDRSGEGKPHFLQRTIHTGWFNSRELRVAQGATHVPYRGIPAGAPHAAQHPLQTRSQYLDFGRIAGSSRWLCPAGSYGS